MNSGIRIAVSFGFVATLAFTQAGAQNPAPSIPDFSTGSSVWVSRQANQMPPPLGAVSGISDEISLSEILR